MSNKVEEYYICIDFTLLPVHTVGTINGCLSIIIAWLHTLSSDLLIKEKTQRQDPISKHEGRGCKSLFSLVSNQSSPIAFCYGAQTKQPTLPILGSQSHKIEFWWNRYPPTLVSAAPSIREVEQHTDSYSELRLRQGQRPVCSSCQTQLSLGEEMVQWVSNFTAPSPRTNSWTGKAERTIKHLFFTYEFILRMHCYISISRLISIFISSRSLSLGSFEGLRSYLLQCRITRLLHEHCKLLSPFSFTLWHGIGMLGWVLISMCHSIDNDSINHLCICAGISAEGQ